MVVRLGGVVIADTRRAMRVLETSHPPVWYVPAADIADGVLERSARHSYCEFKGVASYWTVLGGDHREADAGWSYPEPVAAYAALTDAVAFYPGRMDECTVDGEVVAAQAGDFYGGWVTTEIRGPFKGAPGTAGW